MNPYSARAKQASRARLLAVLACCLSTALAGGCTASGNTAAGNAAALPETTVTVTQPPSSASASGLAGISDVTGRRFDLGQIQSVRTVEGTLVVELDRWTLLDISDSTLARVGLPIRPHREQLSVNQNSAKTYTALVAPQAQIVLNTCVPAGSGRYGLTSQPGRAVEWLKRPNTSTLLLVTYDDQGRITRLDTDPRCR